MPPGTHLHCCPKWHHATLINAGLGFSSVMISEGKPALIGMYNTCLLCARAPFSSSINHYMLKPRKSGYPLIPPTPPSGVSVVTNGL
jgi:hypothetical protein